jgi:hypothetical protein
MDSSKGRKSTNKMKMTAMIKTQKAATTWIMMKTQAAMGVGILANNPLDRKMISRPPIVRLVLPQCPKVAFSIE